MAAYSPRTKVDVKEEIADLGTQLFAGMDNLGASEGLGCRYLSGEISPETRAKPRLCSKFTTKGRVVPPGMRLASLFAP
jgi:hypothetical protein